MDTVERWAMSDHPVDERDDAWRHAISSTHLAWDLHTRRDVPAVAARAATATARRHGEIGEVGDVIRRRTVGPVAFVDCVAGPCSGERGPRQARADEEHIGVLFVLGGSEVVVGGEVQMELAAGSVAVWDSTQPMRFRVPHHVHKRTLLIPRARAADLVPHVDRLGGTLLAPTSTTRVLCDLVGSVIADPFGTPTCDDAPSAALANAALELLAGALTTAAPGAGSADLHARRWELVHDVIEAGLRDPQLNPTAIAAATSLSVRALYLLFEARGDTVARYVKRRRLARARSELERRPDLTVAAVAHRWGFNDQASFARAFRAQYGTTPGQARAGEVRPR